MKTLLLGLSGKKGSGKSTIATLLTQDRAMGDVGLTALASPIKSICTQILGLSHEQVYGTDAQKNTHTLYHLGTLLNKDMGPRFQPATAREVMQIIGTEWFRRLDPDIWVKALIRHVQASSHRMIVVDDVRFPNEVKGIQHAGGKVIRLTRSLPGGSQDQHASETALDGFDGYDAEINNQELDVLTTYGGVRALLDRWGWVEDPLENASYWESA